MDVVRKLAEKFVNQRLSGRITKYDSVIATAQEMLADIDDQGDKIKFITVILEGNQATYDLHLVECTSPETCDINFAHEAISYYLSQELQRLGVEKGDDTFTVEEKNSTESKLDLILRDLQELKVGQQIIYDDVQKEIQELKELYFLGKKKWHQLLLGKCIEMAASGIISETVSKQIVSSFGPIFNKLVSG